VLGKVLYWTLAASMVACPVIAQPRVQVGAETRIELLPEETSGRLVAAGVLRDDLGMPLRARTIDVRVTTRGAEGASTAGARVTTSAEGRFSADFQGTGRAVTVEAEFHGDDRYEPSAAAREVVPDVPSMRLLLLGDGRGRLDMDVSEHRFRFAAVTATRVEGAQIALFDGERSIAEGQTGADGEAELVVPTTDLGAPGTVRLLARGLTRDGRSAATLEIPTVRFLRTTLSLRVVGDSPETDGSVAVEGALRTSRGPVVRKAISVWNGDRHLRTWMTDERGMIRMNLSDTDLLEPHATLFARFDPDAPWWGASRSNDVHLEFRGEGGVPWGWVLGSMLATLSVVALAGSRRGADGGHRHAHEDARPKVELGQRSASHAESLDASGIVLNARTGEAVRDAKVSSVGTPHAAAVDADGRFTIRLPAGGHVVEVSSPGYAPVRHRLVTPHRGEWSGAKVRMSSLRDLAWEPLRPLAASLLPSPDLWGRWTGREMAKGAHAARGGTGKLSELIEMVERASYGRTPPSPGDLDAIHQEALAVHQDLHRHDGPPAASPRR